MKASTAASSDLALLFSWDPTGRRRLALAGFIIGSLILHALCFYAFQIIYPPTVALLPPPGRVTLISASTQEGRSLLNWLEAEDPALASTTQPLPGGKTLTLPTVQHAPSYLMRRPKLRELPPSPEDSTIPSAHPPAPIETRTALKAIVPETTSTTVRLSTNLEALGPIQMPKMQFDSSNPETPSVAEFRIAIDGTGAIRYIFLENSSGDVNLDEQARKHLSLSRFPSIRNLRSENGNQLTWGTATVEWGNDIVLSPAPAETVAP